MNVTKLTNYHGNASLLAEMRALLVPSYESMTDFALKGLIEPVPGMEHELFIIRNEAGALLAFFTVGYHYVEYTLCCYLGLSAVRDDYKGQGLGRQLWEALFEDCRQMERRIGHRILLYFCTVNRIPFAWFAHELEESAPTATGHCDELGRQRLRTVAAAQYPHATYDAAVPYLLRGAAPGVRYAAAERQRMAEAAARDPDNFFNSVGLHEADGDRLLVVGFAPTAS